MQIRRLNQEADLLGREREWKKLKLKEEKREKIDVAILLAVNEFI